MEREEFETTHEFVPLDFENQDSAMLFRKDLRVPGMQCQGNMIPDCATGTRLPVIILEIDEQSENYNNDP